MSRDHCKPSDDYWIGDDSSGYDDSSSDSDSIKSKIRGGSTTAKVDYFHNIVIYKFSVHYPIRKMTSRTTAYILIMYSCVAP